jgi:tellurite resistance protein TerC
MTEFWPVFIIVIQLIFLEGVLSIDNAAVIGALVTPLPEDKAIEWPRRLHRLGNWLHPVLGNQRMAALRVGLLGAYLGRGAMLFMTSFLINNSWIKLKSWTNIHKTFARVNSNQQKHLVVWLDRLLIGGVN